MYIRLDHCAKVILSAVFLLPAYTTLAATSEATAEKRHEIEEVIVTAERKEASIQDTSISITAFTGEFLDDYGIRNQEDLQNYVPSMVILPYDAAIRGIGRNFRALGGDPGIATYMNGIYSEDLLTATAATFWDVERIEVLRGPQGTLYGRNAIGGAINILYKEPTDTFEGAFQGIAGNYGTQEYYGALSGPLFAGVLDGRVNFSLRDRDGVVENHGLGANNDSLGTENIAVQLKFTPIDTVELNIRQNYMNIDRNFGSANGGGLVTYSEQGNQHRNYRSITPGYRFVNPAQTTNPLARDYYDQTQPLLTFTNPCFPGNCGGGGPTTATNTAQAIRAGFDQINGPSLNGTLNTAASLNSFGNTSATNAAINDDCVLNSNPKGEDVCAATNGFNWESFEQNGTQFNASWDVTDWLQLKYLYGRNSLVYQRDTDSDNTASLVSDRQFYVNHEADYSSHEFQAFIDVTDSISLTSGIFFYDATINQRGDFYSRLGQAEITKSRPYVDNTSSPLVGGLSATTLAFGNGPMVNLYSARNGCNVPNPAPGCFRNAALSPFIGLPGGMTRAQSQNQINSKWYGDNGSDPRLNVKHGPSTIATDLLYATKTEREAFAAYTQGVWDINETFTLTLGARYAYDDVNAEENLFRYTQTNAVNALYGGLAAINLVNGGLILNGAGQLQPTEIVTAGGIPLAVSVYRPFHRQDEKWTGRVNLDWNLTDSAMMYFSVTSGYRSGGYSLVYFSQTPTYDPEELTAYEIGYKTQWFDNTLQLNGSFYYYDYDKIGTFATEVSPIGGTSTSVLSAPGAEVEGIELEVLWLVSDNVSVGTNLSYTPSEYTEDLFIADLADSNIPGSLFPNFEGLTQNIKGNQLLQVPDAKAAAWASYKFNLARGSLELFGTYSWISQVYFTPFENADNRADDYDRWDARATWTSTDAHWIVTGFCNNILDEVGVLHIERVGEEGMFRQLAATTAPRLYGVEFTYKFGDY